MKRVILIGKAYDANDVQSMSFSESAGAFKQVNVGPKLINVGLVNAAKFIGSGKQLAIWCSIAGSTVTMGGKTVASLALGSGGIPLALGWNYLAMGDDSWVIASDVNAFVFIIDDTTEIKA